MLDVFTGDCDFTALCARNIQRATVGNMAADASQTNGAASIIDTPGADDTFVIDNLAENISRSMARHDHRTAFCTDLSGIIDRRIQTGGIFQNRFIHLKIDQSVTVEIDDRFSTGRQIHITDISNDQSFIGNGTADQGDRPASGGFDHPSVDDRTGIDAFRYPHLVLAIHEFHAIHV